MFVNNKCFLFILVFSLNCFANNLPNTLEKRVDSILISRPRTFKKIHKLIKPFSRDTTKLKKIITRFDQKSYLPGKIYAENFLGICYRNYSLYNKAITWHQKALENAKKDNHLSFEVFSLNMLGVVYRRLNVNLTAMDYHKKALAIAENVPVKDLGLKRGVAVSYNSIGNIYLTLEQYDLAIAQFEKSQKIEKEINNYFGLAINYQNVGYAKNELGELDEALTFYEKSLVYNKKIKNKLGIIISNASIAEIFIKKGKYKKAVKILLEVLPVGIAIKDQYHLCDIYVTLAWGQLKLKQFTQANKNLNKALEIANKYNFSNYLSLIFLHKSELYSLKNKPLKALEAYKTSANYDKQIRNSKTLQYVNDLMIKYDSEKKSNQIEQLSKQNQIAKLKFQRLGTFVLTVVVLFLGVFIFVYFYNKQKLLEREKKILILEQDILRARMNPHFIFNALNSIKLFIVRNNQQDAVLYLNKFSKLIRKILETSGANLISLEEELAVAKLYISIENTRFSDQVNYIEKVTPKIDLSKILVPPLILQPFLENALWHGLSLKEGAKNISLTVINSGPDFIEVKIEDNGIGRIEAQKIKSKKIINSKSIGLKLTQERLKNHATEHKKGIHLDILDLYDASKKARGTRVLLKLEL